MNNWTVFLSGHASGSPGLSRVLAFLGVLVFLFLALALMAFLHREHRFKMGWGFLAALFTAGGMLVCLIASQTGTLVARPSGDAQEAVTGFFDALLAKDYDRAYDYLSLYSGLGLEGQAEGEVGQAMLAALRESYAYQLYGSCDVDGLEARQEVQFTYLDLPSLEEDAAEKTMEILASFVEERPRSEVYDEDNHYLPQVAQEAYRQAVMQILSSPAPYYETVGLQLELEYVDGNWFLIPSQSLLTALAGGAA